MGKKVHSYIVGGAVRLVQPLWKAVWRFLRKLVREQFDPITPLLGLYPKDLKLAYYSDAAVSIFIAAQFTTAKLCNQPRCPSTDEQIKKLVYTHNEILLRLKEE